jgi:hypothetical protein
LNFTASADWELDENFTVGRRIIVGQNSVAALHHLDADRYEVALRAVDPTSFQFGLEQNIASFIVT